MALSQDIYAGLRVIAASRFLAAPEISLDERGDQPGRNLHRQGAASSRSPAPILVAAGRSAHGTSTLAAQSHTPVRTASLPTLRHKHHSILCDDEIPARKGRGRKYPALFWQGLGAAGYWHRRQDDAFARGVDGWPRRNGAADDRARR